MSSKYIPLSNLPPPGEDGSAISEGELPSYETGASLAQQTEGPDSASPPTTVTFTVTPKFFGGEKGKYTVFRLGFAVERGYDEFKALVKRKLDSAPGLPPGFSDDFILGYYFQTTFVNVNTNEDLASMGGKFSFRPSLVCLRTGHLDLLEKQDEIYYMKLKIAAFLLMTLILSFFAFVFYMIATEDNTKKHHSKGNL